jgi:hypothetical protein
LASLAFDAYSGIKAKKGCYSIYFLTKVIALARRSGIAIHPSSLHQNDANSAGTAIGSDDPMMSLATKDSMMCLGIEPRSPSTMTEPAPTRQS